MAMQEMQQHESAGDAAGKPSEAVIPEYGWQEQLSMRSCQLHPTLHTPLPHPRLSMTAAMHNSRDCQQEVRQQLLMDDRTNCLQDVEGVCGLFRFQAGWQGHKQGL